MPYVKELTITHDDQRRAECEANIARALNHITMNQRRIADETTERAHTEACHAELTQFLGLVAARLPEVMPDHAALTHVRIMATTHANTLLRLRQNIAARQENIATQNNSLAQHRMRLSTLPTPRTVTLTVNQVKQELKGLPVTNIRLFKSTNGSSEVHCLFPNILMTPSSNPYWWLNDGKTDFALPLPPVVAKFSLTWPGVLLKPHRSHLDEAPSGFINRHSAHPHVTQRDGRPCLGDYQSVLIEALSNTDIKTAVLITKLFLEHANDADPAGHTWIQWLMKQLPPRTGRAFVPYNGVHHDRMNLVPNDTDAAGTVHCLYVSPTGQMTVLTTPTVGDYPRFVTPPAFIPRGLSAAPPVRASDDTYGEDGYDADGYDNTGYDREGYDEDGYDGEGRNRDGVHYDEAA